MLKHIASRSALIAFACSASICMPALADERRQINVPPGELSAALKALTQQSGVDLVYRSEQLEGLSTQGVSGTFSPQEAVRRLLEGTALTVKTDSSGAMLIALPRSVPTGGSTLSSAPNPPSAGAPLSAAATAESPSAQQPGARSGDATIDTVTVEALRRRELLERQLSTFVSAITIPARHESLPRWQVPICPLVAGLPFEEGKFVFQRVSQVASEAGIPLGPPDCSPNLLVVMTREPEALLEKWWDKEPHLFNTDRGVAGIKRKIRAAAPVRVFYNACSVPPGLAKTFGVRVLGYCGTGVPGSKLTWSAVRVIYSVIVVVDKRQTEGLEIGQVTDYIGMISLAHIRRDPDLGDAPTILRLFESDSPRPQTLSTWDRTFLKSLYDTDASSVAHLSEIKRRMKQDLAR